MAKAYILNGHLDGSDLAKLEATVRSAGYTPVRGAPADASVLDPAADIGVVGLPALPKDKTNIDDAMMAFAGAGVRIVCIWLHEDGTEDAGVPAGVGKYGVTVDIDSTDLDRVLSGETNVWEGPGGAENPAPITKRHRC